jgi:hypothetical protein
VRDYGEADAYGHRKKASVAESLANEIKRRTGEETMTSDLTYDLRSGDPDFVDKLAPVRQLYGVSDTDKHYASIIHATIPISTTTTAAIRATIARRRRRSSNSRNSPSKYIRPAANEFARLGSASSNKPLSKGEKMMA